MPETIFRAMTGFNEPEQNQDLFIKLDDSFYMLKSKQINSFFLSEINHLKRKIDTNTFMPDSIIQWGELISLQVESLAKASYPIDTMPSLIKEAVIAISEHVQAPIAMTAQCVIGTISHIAQARVNAPNKFTPQGEPCSLYLITEGQSGSRKSTSRNMADKAILEHERKQYEIYRYELEQWTSGHAGLNKKDRETYSTENPPPQDPSTLFSDI